MYIFAFIELLDYSNAHFHIFTVSHSIRNRLSIHESRERTPALSTFLSMINIRHSDQRHYVPHLLADSLSMWKGSRFTVKNLEARDDR